MKGRDRNKLCSCGSGKKYKKCCHNKTKIRKTSVVVKFKEPLDLTKKSLNISFKHDNVDFFVNGEKLSPEISWIETSYNRLKGDKILNYTPNIEHNIVGNANFGLNSYDLIYAIDTNTKNIKNCAVSICCAVSCEIDIENDKVCGTIRSQHLFEFRDQRGAIENYAWHFLINNLIENSINIRVGIIVDSDLDNIPKYNNRELPIINDYFLPKNINLIYASSDAGKEFITNKLISLCDREANKLLTYIEQHWESLWEWPEANVPQYYLFRKWYKK